MANERITEDIVRSHLKDDILFNVIRLEEQKSSNKRIQNLLDGASKSGQGVGKPEFLISFPSGAQDYLIVIECKASPVNHRSPGLDKPNDYAVDGVLHYGSFLAKDYTVLCIAVSGCEKDNLRVSHFLCHGSGYESLSADNKLLSINDYLQIFKNSLFEANLKNVNIIDKAIYLNELFQAYSVTESIRCTFISGILIGLTSQAYRSSYNLCTTALELTEATIAAIKSAFTSTNGQKREEMLAEYSKLLNEPLVMQDTIKHRDKHERESTADVLKYIVAYLDKYIFPLTQMDNGGYDVLGRFYTEFIRYAGSEQSQGLVLTPFHITDLFVDLADVTENSVVYDPCAGSAGFLISAMKRMIGFAGNDQQKAAEIKQAKLIGVELRPSMFTYACSNMMLRGDGRSNIYRDDCFVLKDEIINDHHPTISFLNPPYDVGTAGQMRFVEHALDVVSGRDGVVVAIVQMSAFVKNERELKSIKESILQKSRVIAVLSMPNDLFYPVGVVTAVIVLKAGMPNRDHKTWFGYAKEDGFVKEPLKNPLKSAKFSN
jgi:type I restriction-modification system DNA methylase subunit